MPDEVEQRMIMSRSERNKFGMLVGMIPGEEFPVDKWCRQVEDGAERLLDTADALESLLRETEAENRRLRERLEHLENGIRNLF